MSRDEGALAQAPVILGGGPVGLVCALLLARAGIACTLLDARPLEDLRRDRRLLALSRGSLNLLDGLLGAGFAPLGAIDEVRVSMRGCPGAARLGAADFDGVSLGATVWYGDLVAALGGAVAAQSLVEVLRPRRALHVDQDERLVRIGLDDERVLATVLAIDAEGTPGTTAPARAIAILAELTLAGLDAGVALERFTPEGPLALLPLPAASANGAAPLAAGLRRMSMVWCLPTELARERLALDEASLRARIGRELGARYGAPVHVGERHAFPLLTHRRQRVVEHRRVHLGNAAQALHPVAGQGFNLGLRDCASLVECLAQVYDAAPAGVPGPALHEALARYERRRRLDRRVIPALTSALPALFSARAWPLAAARSAGLIALDTVPALRRGFTRVLMMGLG